MSALTVWGLKIYLREEHTENTDIGLYTSGGASYFRWIENSITGTSVDYKSGIIAAGGIPPIVEGGDFERGGRFVEVESITVSLCNTAKFYAELDNDSIGINGLRCEVIEFVRDTDAGPNTVETVRGYFKTSVDSWSISKYILPLEPAVYNRNSPMGTIVDIQAFPNASSDDIGKMVPMTFGRFQDEKYAKFIKTSSKEVVKTTSELMQYCFDNKVSGTSAALPSDQTEMNLFPVVNRNADPAQQYTITLSTGIWDYALDFAPTNYYLKVVDGSDVDGQYRKITRIFESPSGMGLTLTIESFFETSLSIGNPTTGDGNGSWVQIVEIIREYNSDKWKCKNFVDNDGVSVSKAVELYAYSGNEGITVLEDDTGAAIPGKYTITKNAFQYFRLPPYGYDIEAGDSNNNRIILYPSNANQDIDTISSYLVLPCTKLELVKEADLTKWGSPLDKRLIDGVYVNYAVTNIIATTLSCVLTDEANAFDKDKDSYAQIVTAYNPATFVYDIQFILAAEFTPPVLPDWFDFDNAYFLVNMTSVGETYLVKTSSDIFLKNRRFLGASNQILDPTIGEAYWDFDTPATVDAVPDFYYESNGGTNNKNFYFNSSISGSVYTTISGHKRFSMSISGKEAYRGVYRLGMLLLRIGESGLFTDTIKIYEATVAFEKKLSISDAIYSTVHGRIYNSTWASRKTSSSVMTSPLDYYEHACRLQNWSERGVESIDYGKEYSSNAQINTTKFDSTRLDVIRNDLAYTFQVTEYEKSWTKIFKEHILASTWCVGYIDEDGKECIDFIPQVTDDTITDTITLADVPDGMSPSEVQEPKPENVFCEPFIRYNWNEGAQRYDGLIAVKQVHRGTGNWEAVYTPGFSGGEGEQFWEFCTTELWSRYHQVEDPPSSLTDQPFISTEDNAKWFLQTWLDWMLVRRITIPVYYAKAKTWHVGRHIYINFPHQTNSVAREAVVERIVKNKNGNVCEVSVAFWVETPVEYYYIETMETEKAENTWIETTTVSGDDTDKVEGM
jgi:hypothetical protein